MWLHLKNSILESFPFRKKARLKPIQLVRYHFSLIADVPVVVLAKHDPPVVTSERPRPDLLKSPSDETRDIGRPLQVCMNQWKTKSIFFSKRNMSAIGKFNRMMWSVMDEWSVKEPMEPSTKRKWDYMVRWNSKSCWDQWLMEFIIRICGIERIELYFTDAWTTSSLSKRSHSIEVCFGWYLNIWIALLFSCRKISHQNTLSFYGYILSPRFAIVTQWCEVRELQTIRLEERKLRFPQGSTLHKHIHILERQWEITQWIDIARQISQGIS